MGGKTQIATVALAAKYTSLVAVVAGTTCGMLLANVPVVYFGDKLTRLVPIKVVHIICALIFVALGLAALLNLGVLL
jgi:Ca2+/H+ antiporter, TMEM165/GDT1 family